MTATSITFFLAGKIPNSATIEIIKEKMANVVILHNNEVICNATSLTDDEVMHEYDKATKIREERKALFELSMIEKQPLQMYMGPRKSESQPWSKEARRRR